MNERSVEKWEKGWKEHEKRKRKSVKEAWGGKANGN